MRTSGAYTNRSFSTVRRTWRSDVLTQPECRCTQTLVGARCTSTCLNRRDKRECPPSCGSMCTNRAYARNEWPATETRSTTRKGNGTFAKAPILKGQTIASYGGLLVSVASAITRAKQGNVYCLGLDDTYSIDGEKVKGQARLINHSCMPNAKYETWTTNDGMRRRFIIATHNISTGQEITTNYGAYMNATCECNHPACKNPGKELRNESTK